MRQRLSLITTAAITAMLTGQALSFTEPSAKHELSKSEEFKIGINVVRPNVVKGDSTKISTLEGVKNVSVKKDKASGAIRVISGSMLSGARLERSANPADVVDAAVSYIAENQELLGVSADDVKLNKNALLIDKDVQFVKFDVYRNGIKIEDASIDLRFKQGQLVQVLNMSFAEASTDNRQSQAGLDKVARGMLLADSATHLGSSYRVRQANKGYELVLVERFTVDTSADRFTVSVEAANAKIFEVRPSKFNLDGDAAGEIHARWYGEALTSVPYSGLNLADASGSITTDANGNFAGAPESAQPKLDGFVGPQVKVELKSGVKVVREGLRVRDRWNVVFAKNDQAPAIEDTNVAQSMLFYHTNAIINTARKYIQSPWFDTQLIANANLTQNCNAHWDGTTINFYSAGGGCANTGLISDVVFHEWGHGLDHNTGGIADGAFSEGFGDIMSLIKTRSNILGIGFRTTGAPVRDLAPDKVYPVDAGGGVHSEGLIIGSTFYDLYTALRDIHGDDQAIEILSQYAFKMVFTAARYTEVYDALLVIDDNDADPSNKTPNYCTLNKTFAAHGLATPDVACELAAIEAFEIDDSQGNGNGIIEPGETIKLWMNALNAAATDLTGLIGNVSVTGAPGVTVSNGLITWDIVPAGTQLRSITPATLDVASNVTCGSEVDVKVNLSSGTRTAVANKKLYVGNLAGLPLQTDAAGLPLSIPDDSAASADITISGAQWNANTTVLNAQLKFNITHPYVGDIVVSLTGPDGTVKEIYKGSGSGDNVTFNEDISDKLKGMKGTGVWKINIQDTAAQDIGTLDSTTLTLTPAYFECQ
jgi:subtilisin-like proprotein convertase family protein